MVTADFATYAAAQRRGRRALERPARLVRARPSAIPPMSAGSRPTAPSASMPGTSGTFPWHKCVHEQQRIAARLGSSTTQEVAALVAGTHRDPFARLGLHAADDGFVRPRLRSRCRPRRGGVTLDGRAGRRASTGAAIAGFFEGKVAVTGASARSATTRANAGGELVASSIPTASARCSGRWTTTTSPRARISGSSTSSAPTSSPMRASHGVHFAVWAPNASARLGGRRLQRLGRPPPRHAPSPSTPACGKSSSPSSAPATRLQVRDHRRRRGSLLPLKADPFALRLRDAAARPPRSSPSPAPFTGTTSVYLGARGDARPAPRADVDLRGPSRLVAARMPTAGSSPMTSSPTELIPYVADLGFTHIELLPITEHPLDASWGYQPTGLFAPTARFGDPAGFARFVDRAHAGRHRRHPRLGAGAFPDRRARPRPLRRHGALRARRSAPRLPSRLEHRDLQFRPHRGGQLPHQQRALLARALPRRRPARRCRRLDALSRLFAQGRRMAPQRVWRQRESRGDRLPAGA